jgi:hypothetical protein
MRRRRWACSTLLSSLALTLAVTMGAPGCSAPAENDPEPTESPALEGVYYSEGEPALWTGFKGQRYVTWTSPDHEESGTYELDSGHQTLRLTDGATGRVRSLPIRIEEITKHGELAKAGSVAPRNLVTGPTQLTRSDVITQYSLYDSSKSTTPLVQEAGWREMLHASCMLLTIYMGDPSRPVPRPPPPPPIVQTMSDCPKKG